ncbi:MAG: quinolinate synthase NadA [Syntrophales bacterium]|jgi:quinolinate synthase|nr:quinolinate synthase NadA [Syntrophales bacterium]
MEIADKIKKLKRERNAVILVHNYQLPEVQDIADFIGDSLGLSMEAARTDAEVIVFCGVYFMAETAKILSPDKIVLLPDPRAGCPMADMITADELKTLKAGHPGAQVLCYVNTTAEVKAECDLCCTSANAEAIVRQALSGGEEIIFVPDKHLGDFVIEKTGKQMILWQGFCPTHAKILPEHVMEQKRLHPEALVLAHPECPRGVRHLSDEVLSTEAMCRVVKESDRNEVIVATEVGIIHRLRKENPGKVFYPASEHAVCPNMKRINLEKIMWSLEEMTHQVDVPRDVADRARACIDRMLMYSR